MSVRAIKPFLELCRISNLPTVWTNVIAAVVLSVPEARWSLIGILALSLSSFYMGGMCLNDIYDREADRTGKPFRPLPSGRVPVRAAFYLTAMLFAAGLLLLLVIPYREALWAGFVLFIVIVLYDKFHKTHPASIMLMAMSRAMVFVIAGIAAAGAVTVTAAIAGVVQFCYTLLISTIARVENTRKERFPFPVIPAMIACISLIDGALMASFASPSWLLAGLAGALLTLAGQAYVRGD
ncbi:MAG: UbiA family prenyltransferase [Nitrospirota bacterium]